MASWPHGPVVPSVWHEFKRYSWQPIEHGGASEGIEEDSLNILEQVRDAYGSCAAKKLEAMTHSEPPCISARGGRAPKERCEKVIFKESILGFCKETYGELEDSEEVNQG